MSENTIMILICLITMVPFIVFLGMLIKSIFTNKPFNFEDVDGKIFELTAGQRRFLRSK